MCYLQTEYFKAHITSIFLNGDASLAFLSYYHANFKYVNVVVRQSNMWQNNFKCLYTCFKGTAKASATWELQVGDHETFVFELRNKIK